MESQLYYRSTDLATAMYLEQRLGNTWAYAHSVTSHEGIETSQGLSELPVPLLAPQDILQLKDEEVIGFHQNLPPFQMKRIDWRQYPLFKQRKMIAAPIVPELPKLAEIPTIQSQKRITDVYIDPDRVSIFL